MPPDHDGTNPCNTSPYAPDDQFAGPAEYRAGRQAGRVRRFIIPTVVVTAVIATATCMVVFGKGGDGGGESSATGDTVVTAPATGPDEAAGSVESAEQPTIIVGDVEVGSAEELLDSIRISDIVVTASHWNGRPSNRTEIVFTDLILGDGFPLPWLQQDVVDDYLLITVVGARVQKHVTTPVVDRGRPNRMTVMSTRDNEGRPLIMVPLPVDATPGTDYRIFEDPDHSRLVVDALDVGIVDH